MKKYKRIFVEISNICNLSCTFCPVSIRPKKAMSVDDFESVLKKIEGHGDHIYLHVKGEPLYHKNFKEILDLCHDYHKKINLTTNGTLLDLQGQTILDNKAVRLVSISLQSFEDAENVVAYQAYLTKVLTFVKKGLSESKIIFNLRLWNFEDANLLPNENAKMTIKFIEDFLQLSAPITINDPSVNSGKLSSNAYISKGYEFEWPSLKNETANETGSCYGLRHQIAILSNGDVVPCCLDSEGVINLGNIFESDFESIIDSNRSRAIAVGFENNKLIEPLCKKCGYRERFIK